MDTSRQEMCSQLEDKERTITRLQQDMTKLEVMIMWPQTMNFVIFFSFQSSRTEVETKLTSQLEEKQSSVVTIETRLREAAQSHDQAVREKEEVVGSLNARVLSLERELQLQTEALEVSVEVELVMDGNEWVELVWS